MLSATVSARASVTHESEAASASGETASTETDKLYYSLEGLRRRNGWLASGNAAGLATYSAQDFSDVRLYGSFASGALRDVCSPKRDNRLGLDAQAYQRLGKATLYGRFLFDYDMKQAQRWSSMTRPGSSTFLIGDSTAGNQVCETYLIDGGLSLPLGGGLTLGAAFDFEYAANAKRKDIRNKNNYSRYHLRPALMWQRGGVRLGANYAFGSETEKIEWTVYGDKMQHEVFFFEGLWFGPSEITTTSITERRFERYSHELALQSEVKLRRGNLYNALSLTTDEQKVYVEVEQERGGENRRAAYRYDGQLWLAADRLSHSLQWSAGHSYAKSYQNLQQRELVGYIYQYVQYGRLLRFTESQWDARMSYQLAGLRGAGKGAPAGSDAAWSRSWALTFDASFGFTEQRFRTFPTVFAQQVRQASASLAFAKSLLTGNGLLDLEAKAMWQTGWGRCVDPVDAEATNGYQYRADLQRASFEYATAQRLGGMARVRHTWSSLGSHSVMPYAEATFRSVGAIDGALKGDVRRLTSIAVGLKF
jgi:hypothetical protein